MYLDGLEHETARELTEKALRQFDLAQIVETSIEAWFSHFFDRKTIDLIDMAAALPVFIFNLFYKPLNKNWQVWPGHSADSKYFLRGVCRQQGI